jgi:hypothetical protein
MLKQSKWNPHKGSGLASMGTMALVLTILGFILLMVLAMEDVTDAKDTARLAEAQQNLHDIQLSTERFWVDNDVYPAYLTGGQRLFTRQADASADRPFEEPRVIVDLTQVPDPLLRQGYLEYPRNPFMKGDEAACVAVHQMQLSIPGAGVVDPMRNGDNSMGGTAGTRFGSGCGIMGQVLADARYPQVVYTSDEIVGGGPYPSYADTGYPFYDIYAGDQPKPYLPGEFFYKSNGVTLSADSVASETEPVLPDKPRTYIMGLYGPRTDKGKDIIGDEQQVTGWVAGADGKLGADPAAVKCWPWTRSTLDPAGREGCPFLPGKPGEAHQYQYGNPNGIRDGLALILTSGSPDE